jgi:hypothetical protein
MARDHRADQQQHLLLGGVKAFEIAGYEPLEPQV